MKTLTTLSIILMASWASAQSLWPHPPQKQVNSGVSEIDNTSKQTAQLHAKAGSSLWSEDFENGLNGWTVDVAAGAVEWMTTTTGNTGGFTPGPLESTTGFSGGTWIVADSDLQGTAGIQEVTTITSPPITGLDGYPALLLSFEQSFRQLNDDQTTVEISPDGGITWTTFPVNEDVPGNQSTPGAPASELISLNISSALNGGASDLRIRFRWVSFEGFTYSWQVDDINLNEALTDDLVIEEVHYTEWDFDSADDFSDLEYSIYPVNQLREFKFEAVVHNNGINDQTGVTLNVEVDGPGGNDYSDSSSSLTIASGEMDSLNITGYIPPAILGDYSINYEIVQDQTDLDPSTNTASRSFSIEQYIYARDLGAMDGVYDNQGEAYELGNWFGISEDGNTLYAVDVALTNNTAVDAVVIAVVYDSNRDYITESEEYLVQASDLNGFGDGNFISLRLFDEVVLEEGEDYFVAVKHFGGNDNVEVATSGTSIAQTSLIFDTPVNDWFYVTSTPMVRMNLNESVGIAEANGSLVEKMDMYPNPAAANTTLSFELVESAEVELSVVNVLGAEVIRTDMGHLAPGSYLQRLATNRLDAGTYFVRLSANGADNVSKLMVE